MSLYRLSQTSGFWFASLRVFVEYLHQFVFSTSPGEIIQKSRREFVSLNNSNLCSSDPRRDGLVSVHDVSHQDVGGCHCLP